MIVSCRENIKHPNRNLVDDFVENELVGHTKSNHRAAEYGKPSFNWHASTQKTEDA
jgi:hypothetical protein